MKSEMPTLSLEAAPVTLPPTIPQPRKSSRQISVHISGTTVPDCFCELVGIDSGILYVRSERQIPESSSIFVAFDHVQLSGIVAGCHAAEQDWVISIALASCKRRLEERFPAGEKSVIGIVEHHGTTLREGSVIDASSSGLGLRLSQSIDPGARIYVETESTMVFGEVRHCRPTANGEYIVGVMIVEVVQDVRNQNMFSVMLNSLRWKLASSIRGRDLPAPRPHI